MNPYHRPDNRQIIKRIIIKGTLRLDTPTCLGTGDNDSLIDLSLLRDNLNKNLALLTGSSIAGALRNYLREYCKGYCQHDLRGDVVTKLFGDLFNYINEVQLSEQDKIEKRKMDNQSLLIVDDAISSSSMQTELRDGVKINSVTRTAENKRKYDLELLEVGTEFPLNFELLVEEEKSEHKLKKALAIALDGLTQGKISIGMKKHRGFGRCHVKEWQVWEFDLRNPDERLAWLNFKHWKQGLFSSHTTHESIQKALGLFLDEKEDERDFCAIHAKFTLATPLLIRSGQASSDKAPDVVHLKSRRNGELKPILSGTALAGVLRHRAERIIKTIGKNTSIIEDIFGSDLEQKENKYAKASRLVVHESVIKESTDLVQNRIAIDRFTGGALHGALFNEQPVFVTDQTELNLEIELRKPADNEIGLLLLLLKDLWTGDLPIGGASSIGRGRLQGKEATITLRTSQEDTTWTIWQSSPNESSVISDVESLEKFVAAL